MSPNEKNSKNSKKSSRIVDNLFTAGSDSNGKNERFQIRCIPQHVALANTMVARPDCPHRNISELGRTALRRHLEFLNKTLKLGLDSYLLQINMMLLVLDEHEENLEFEKMFHRLGNLITQYVATSRVPEAQGLLDKLKELVDAMPDCVQKERYSLELLTRFGHIYNNPLLAEFLK